ncbi:PAS and ANTAR domain-containing protein [Nocardioides panaciterrulae]|uniref:histidine kinase n=1 Tax=Nocardioides panaciterrulae TaxID=661492 RepID=A0A7Y9E748_9ACTN|nr:PAS and ANTAR domain-containing protein [Nocardioides panaciterrulae]NYD42237.1 hypothetical protein [Nocardioides panaciterrulae]
MPTASYVYWAREDRWDWSDAMFRLHGFEPGEIMPTTDLLLRHKHPDDVASVRTVFGAALREGRAFVCRHRIIDAQQHQRTVVAFGFPQHDPSGEVRSVRGTVADVTRQLAHDTRQATAAAVEGATATRGVIDQAKGCLMARYGLDPEEAFTVLRAISNHTNRRVHDLAGSLIELLTSGPTGPDRPARTVAEVESLLAAADRRPGPS